jgi:hypothetical protein
LPQPANRRRCRAARRAGLTLIEIIVATILAATLSVQVLAITREHGRQVRQAQLKARAIVEAETLLGAWYERPGGPPRTAQGSIAAAGLSWRLEPVDRPLPPSFPAELLRLSLRSVEASESDPPIASVEILAPKAAGAAGAAP